MFTAGAYAAQWAQYPVHDELVNAMDPDLPVNRTVLGDVQGTHETFETNLKWFAAALAVELTCIALVLPTYWGWWKLGRPVSFSPLEIAKVRCLSLYGVLASDLLLPLGFRSADVGWL